MSLTIEQVNDLSKDRLCIYCEENKCTDWLDACNGCVKQAEYLGCEVDDLPSLKKDQEKNK